MGRKTKIQREAELLQAKQQQETKRLRALIKDQVYPVLLADCQTVHEAQTICQGLAVSIKTAYTNGMNDVKVTELSMDKQFEKVDKKSPVYQTYKKVWEILNTESVLAAAQLLEGFSGYMQGILEKEKKTRKFAELKVDLL